jgi:hypothetical protein
MGMFDTFITKDHNGATVELQSKKFTNVLNYWKIGDILREGVDFQVLYKCAELREDGELAFHSNVTSMVFYIVIVDDIYVDSSCTLVAEDSTEHEISNSILQYIRALQDHWSDTEVKYQRLLELHNQSYSLAKYQQNRILRLIKTIDHSLEQPKYTDASGIKSIGELLEYVANYLDGIHNLEGYEDHSKLDLSRYAL